MDQYGQGPGVYPKTLAPKAPAHPYCRCHLQPLTGLDARTKWQERPGAAQAWIRAQGINDGASIMGSRERLKMVLDGADPVAVHNSRIDPMYQVRLVGGGDVAPLVVDRMPVMNESYKIAKEGGRHGGMLKNYSDLPRQMVERGLRSIEGQISKHEEWIADPFSKLTATIDADAVRYLKERKWPKDVARLREEADVLRGLVEEMKNA
ncbi:MAG: hypothetical protein KBD39_11165 [Sterolibacterium sp.]|nr:hypothetical protein [Sterolibacterium sp.]MBP9800662.1 hypothetical protein [Sterolibacterium sp.]